MGEYYWILKKRLKATPIPNNEKKFKEEEEGSMGVDLISYLPEDLIIKILSFLPTKDAAVTSVLSHHWQHFWKKVTSIFLDDLEDRVICEILERMNAEKIENFYLNQSCPVDLTRAFSLICHKNVESLTCIIKGQLSLPGFVFAGNSLQYLNIKGLVKLELDETFEWNGSRLETLCLKFLRKVPICFGTLISCCPLQKLELGFDLMNSSHEVNSELNITAPQLRVLYVTMKSKRTHQHTKFLLHTPMLEKVEIRDCTSCYKTLYRCHKSVEAVIDLTTTIHYNEDPLYWSHRKLQYYQTLAKFIGGLENLTSLTLFVDGRTDFYRHVELHQIPSFLRLKVLKTNYATFLLHMMCKMPCLEHLEFSIPVDSHQELQRIIGFPNKVPICLQESLKTIQVHSPQLLGNYHTVIEYLLLNCSVLEGMDFRIFMKAPTSISEESCIWMELKFCNHLFELPKNSEKCDLMVFGKHIEASSESFNKNRLQCTVFVGE